MSAEAAHTKHAATFVLITVLIDAMGLGIIIPVLPQLITQLSGGEVSHGAQEAGWLGAVYAIMQFFAAPIAGALSDRYGRRPVLLGSLLGLGVDYIFLALAPTLGWLFVGRVIAGITGASFSVAQAYLADVTPLEKRSQAFGMIGAAFGAGFVLGPLLGGLVSELGVRVPFMAAAGLSLLNFIYGYFMVPESLADENRRAFSWKRANPVGALLNLSRHPGVLALMMCMGLFGIAGHANQSASSYVGIARYHWQPKDIGFFLTYVGVMIALAQGVLVGVVIKKLGQLKAAYFGFFFYILGSVLTGFASEGWMFYVFFAVQALGFISGAALGGYMSAQVPASEQGELQGATGAIMSITGAVGSLLMLNLFSYFTQPSAPIQLPGVPYFAAGALVLVAAFIFIGIQGRLKLKETAGLEGEGAVV